MQTDIFTPIDSHKPAKPVTIQDMFAYTRLTWLDECRATARRLLKHGKESVTIEDVTALVPRPDYLHRNVTGSVFNEEFKPIGFVQAKHKAAKGRYIRQWVLK